MASQERIKRLTKYLESTHNDTSVPTWVRGSHKDTQSSLSGRCRRFARMLHGNDLKVVGEIGHSYGLRELLDDLAAALDDAHEDWLNMRIAARSVLSDVEQMRSDMGDSVNWFGGFSMVRERGEWTTETHVEWPNLRLSSDNLAGAIDGEELNV